MKKVAMFLENDFPPDPRVENEAISLIRAGHSIHLFCLSYQKLTPPYEIINGIHVHRFQASQLIYKLSALAYTFPFYRWLISSRIRKFLKEVQPDIMHIHDMTMAETVLRINANKLTCILDLHENKPAIMKWYKHTSIFPGKYLINLNKWNVKQDELISRANFVVTVTEEAKEHYASKLEIDKNKFIVVPNVVDLDVFLGYPRNKEIVDRFNGSFNILYLGDTGLRRGLMTAIEALPNLIKEIPIIKLIIVGKSSSDEELKRRASDLGVSDYVAFEGWQDVSLFPSYIQASDICISPIHRNLHHDTTYANKIFQYMAIGRAQVVSDCPPQARVIEEIDIGKVHKAGDVYDFVKCIIGLYHDKNLRKEMEERSRLASQRTWNWKTTGKDLISLYQSL